MVERERERAEGEAHKALGGVGGPLPREGAEAEGESDGGGGREAPEGYEPDPEAEAEEEERDRDGGEEKAEWSEIRLAVEELSPAAQREPGGGGKAAASSTATLRFLALAHLLLRVLDKMGPTMAVLRLDVQRNIERLQELYLLDPAKYSTLTEVVEKEVKEGTARRVDSCARAVLWLTRSMDFALALLQRLEEEEEEGPGPDQQQQQSLAQATEAAYAATLKPWHGWIASAAYKIAMKLVPDRKAFTGLLLGGGCGALQLKDDVGRLAPLLRALLDDVHSMMAKFRLDRLKST